MSLWMFEGPVKRAPSGGRASAMVVVNLGMWVRWSAPGLESKKSSVESACRRKYK